MNIGIIGAGAISTFLLDTLNKEQSDDRRVHSILVRDLEKYAPLEKKYGITLYTNIDEFLASDIDLVVEAATVEAVREFAPKVIQAKDIVIISIGALVDESFYDSIKSAAKEYGQQIYLPSGAIGSLDVLQHAKSLDEVDRVQLTTRKPAHTLGHPNAKEEVVAFSGTAREAIKQFPKNINVGIVLSLAGIGMDETKVKIIGDPSTEKNTHQIEFSGAFGDVSFTVTNEPLPTNPNTSYLAALSVLGTLKNMDSAIKIG